MRIVLRALAVFVVFAGCESIDERPATFGYIHAAILQPSCTTSNCHSSLTGQAGLRLDDPEAAYVALVGRTCDVGELPGLPSGNLVVPFQPTSSRLMYLLRGDEVDIMPPDLPLPEPEIELIEQWILEGAVCN